MYTVTPFPFRLGDPPSSVLASPPFCFAPPFLPPPPQQPALLGSLYSLPICSLRTGLSGTKRVMGSS